jgi:outer membrane protein TolC
MKNIFLLAILFLSAFGFGQNLTAQQADTAMVLTLTLEQTVEMARTQSPEVLYARHNFRSSYWSYCWYKANYLPSLTFSSSPYFNHTINSITLPDGKQQFVPQNLLSTDANLSVTQNIALTGGSLYLQTGLQRLDLLDDNSFSYKSTPVIVGFSQSLLGYNSLKWDRRIEPVRFEAAKKTYIETLELVAANATLKFFNLARAQTNLHIAQTNYRNADTLYTFAKGRYEIGTISENEMLQLEVNKLQEESNRISAQLDVDDCMEELRSFLGIKDAKQIVTQTDDVLPVQFINIEEALRLALENSPDILNIKLKRTESESSVASAKGNAGLKANLFMQLGLGQTRNTISAAYQNPVNQQYIEIGISFPILDWGRSKGQVQVAKSRRDLVFAQTEQEQNDFEQKMIKLVKQFNVQPRYIEVAARTDQTAAHRSEVARKLYLLGKSTILDLNASISEKDAAKRSYITALYNYWALYYSLRSVTLYDFKKNIPLTEDYSLLIK